MIFLSNRREKFKLLGFQGEHPPPLPSLVPSLSGRSWYPHEENPERRWSAHCLIFFQTKKLTACKNQDQKEETVFPFLMVFNLLKIIHRFESRQHLRIYWNLLVAKKNICYVSNRFKYNFFSENTQLSVTVV